jgi:3-mercaptopyruvate sulfurtransferase SseA
MLKAIGIPRIQFMNLGRHFSTSQSKVLIETGELEELIAKKPDNFTILNASLFRGDFENKAAHINERIPGSIFFDIT